MTQGSFPASSADVKKAQEGPCSRIPTLLIHQSGHASVIYSGILRLSDPKV